MIRVFLLFILSSSFLLNGCVKKDFNEQFYKEHHEMYKNALFTPLHYAIKSELERNHKNKIFYDKSIAFDSLCETFFNKVFLKGDFDLSRIEFNKILNFYSDIFSDKRLFFQSDIDLMKQLSKKMINQETNEQMFFDYLLLRGNSLKKLNEATFSCSWSYKWEQLKIDTIQINENIKLLHIYLKDIVKDQFVASEITALKRNNKNLLQSASILETNANVSLLIPCDMDTGAIHLKAKINKIWSKQIVNSYNYEDKLYNKAYYNR